jgi:aryl-alcohol dehydrogenase-like predicted oxidoreductase
LRYAVAPCVMGLECKTYPMPLGDGQVEDSPGRCAARRSVPLRAHHLDRVRRAIAFVLRHPAVTAVIIGSRTMEHLESQLAAADVELPGDALDRIDEIVPPGTTINPADAGWVSPALQAAARRR